GAHRRNERAGETRAAAAGRREARPSNHCPTIDAPRKFSTSSIGVAIATVQLPANSKPTARGFVVQASTLSEPESPLFKKRLPRFLITIWPVNVFVNATPPAHSLSYCTLTVAFRPVTVLRDSPVVRPLFLTFWPTEAPTVVAEIVPTSRIE